MIGDVLGELLQHRAFEFAVERAAANFAKTSVKSICSEIEVFKWCLRNELRNGEIFYALRGAMIVIKSWRRHFNTIRPHASLG